MMYKVSYAVHGLKGWEKREEKILDFGTSRRKLRECVCYLARCADVRNIRINGRKANEFIAFMTKNEKAANRFLGSWIIVNFDGKRAPKKTLYRIENNIFTVD